MAGLTLLTQSSRRSCLLETEVDHLNELGGTCGPLFDARTREWMMQAPARDGSSRDLKTGCGGVVDLRGWTSGSSGRLGTGSTWVTHSAPPPSPRSSALGLGPQAGGPKVHACDALAGWMDDRRFFQVQPWVHNLGLPHDHAAPPLPPSQPALSLLLPTKSSLRLTPSVLPCTLPLESNPALDVMTTPLASTPCLSLVSRLEPLQRRHTTLHELLTSTHKLIEKVPVMR